MNNFRAGISNRFTIYILGLMRRLSSYTSAMKLGMVGFAVVGTVLLVSTHAATPSASFEAEGGTVAGGALVASDAAASSGQAVIFGSTAPTPTVTMAVNGASKEQTITGLGASINSHSWNNGALKPVLDELIDQNGTKSFRVVMEMSDWESTNDDSDPSNFNWNYYNPIYSGATTYDTAQNGSNFADLWNTIDYLHQRGIPDSQIILSFMGPGPNWMVGSNDTVTSAKESEWVEMVASAAYYGYSRGHTFGIFSPNNEEDWGHNEGIIMSASVYADAMNKVASQLDTLGMSSVRLLGPETSSTTANYVSAMAGYPNLLGKTDHFDFHNYGGSTGGASGIVDNYAGKDFWMSEFSVFNDSFNLLDEGSSGLMMWDAYDSVYNHAIVNGLGTAPGNDAGNAPAWIAYNAGTKVYTPRKSFYQFGQLFKYTQLGMQMVDVQTSKATLDAEAFVHPTSGAVTIVGENTASSTAVIGGTLTGTPALTMLHYTQTNAGSNMAAGADVSVSGGHFSVSVPANTVFTLTTL